mmetsp:Transcript_30912/g.74272  ORF Transcript_30912/g.74272 Transcript_30912/m.74272 type:complete len:102 (+) Transcript_30912:90-395(+)
MGKMGVTHLSFSSISAMDDEDEEPPINHIVTPSEMMKFGLRLRGYTERRLKRAKGKTNVFRFKHHFGVSPCTQFGSTVLSAKRENDRPSFFCTNLCFQQHH